MEPCRARPRPAAPRAPAVALVALLLPGCVVEMDTERPASPIGAVLDDCVVPLPDHGAPVTIDGAGGSLWLFDDASAVWVTDAAAACAGDVEAWPAPVVALTAEEELDNATRTDGRRTALRPRAGFVDGDTTWLYYDVELVGPGFFDVERVATEACALTSRPGTCVRPAPVVWPGLGRDWADAALLDRGTAYLVGCDHVAPFTDLCGLTRVDPARAADPDAYQYLGWDDAWRDDDGDPVVLFDAPASLSASYHAGAGRFLVTVADIWDSRLELRSAPAPTGPWSDPVVLFDVASPPDWFFGGGREHPGLRSADGRTLVFSYTTSAAPAPGLHLVRFRLDDDRVVPW